MGIFIRFHKLQFKRMIKQKALWVYLAALGIIILSQCLEYRQDPTGEMAAVYAGGRFSISALHNQVSLMGPLFFALITAFSVNGEKTAGILKQPLLSGITKSQLLNCKLLNVILVMMITVITLEALSFLVGYIAWGGQVFAQLTTCLAQIGLTMVPLTVSCIGFVLVALLSPNIAVTMCAAFSFLLIDSLVSQFFASAVSKFSYAYYAYAYSGYNGQPVEAWMIPRGLIISLITGVVFYLLAYWRIHRMRF